MTGSSKSPLISEVFVVEQFSDALADTYPLAEALTEELGDTDAEALALAEVPVSSEAAMSCSEPTSHPLARIEAPLGQLSPAYPGNGGMMSPQPDVGNSPPTCVSCPFLSSIEFWLTVISVYGLFRELVR